MNDMDPSRAEAEGVLTQGHTHHRRSRGEGKTGVTKPRVKEGWKPPAGWRRKNGFSPQASGGRHSLANRLTSALPSRTAREHVPVISSLRFVYFERARTGGGGTRREGGRVCFCNLFSSLFILRGRIPSRHCAVEPSTGLELQNSEIMT